MILKASGDEFRICRSVPPKRSQILLGRLIQSNELVAHFSHKARHGVAWIIPADSLGKETTHWQWEIGGSHCILVKCLFVPAKRCSEREVNLASLKCVCQEGEIGGWGGGAAVRLI